MGVSSTRVSTPSPNAAPKNAPFRQVPAADTASVIPAEGDAASWAANGSPTTSAVPPATHQWTDGARRCPAFPPTQSQAATTLRPTATAIAV